MRVSIIPEDGFISKDLLGYTGLVFDIDPTVHAVQWYGAFGEVEFKPVYDGGVLSKQGNMLITDFSPYQAALNAWQAAKDFTEAALADMDKPALDVE